jgi:hypothetical protein
MAMLLRFYVDVHISYEAVLQLRKQGVDIIHCGEVGMSDMPDIEHLSYAISTNRIMVSCDVDFVLFHDQYQAEGKEHTGIVYFQMSKHCKSIGLIVKEILFLVEIADYQKDLYNQLWRA